LIKILSSLLTNALFARNIAYLHPNRLDDHIIDLSDPVGHHDTWDTDIVVLSKFVTGIKQTVFYQYSVQYRISRSSFRQKKGRVET
jgi:hypothetical protein